jgi:hypothetical protein
VGIVVVAVLVVVAVVRVVVLVVVVVVIVEVEDVVFVVQDAKTRDVIMRQVNTIQVIPLFIQTSSYSRNILRKYRSLL